MIVMVAEANARRFFDVRFRLRVSNAAAVMKGLRKIFNLNITDTELEKISVEIGADVPFFYKGGYTNR